jgi:5'-3' exonuclease
MIFSNLEMKPTFIFVDGSYFCFHRYHSLLTWWKCAYPEESHVLDDPINEESFVNKFRKTFVEQLINLPKKLKINKSINPMMIIGRDCKRENIWRNELFPNYKAHRANGPEDGFMGGPFFKMVYEENLFIEGGAKAILKHPKLEADDCIALCVRHLLQKYPECEIYIITSDKDYLQIAGPRVHLYNLAFKKLTDQKSSSDNPECDLFCKILTGDPSDNIPSVFPKCGIKTALQCFNDKEYFTKKMIKQEYWDQYELNKKIIDFNCIPEDLANEFMSSAIN